MRTIPFRSVYEGVVRRHGLSPDADDSVRANTNRAITEHINKRVRMAWRYWEWPELEVTEERAFRTIWNATRSFRRVGANGKPDEFFYIPNMTYYRVKGLYVIDADPPPGTLPTNTTYFEPLTPLDAYVALDEVCQHPIGIVYGVYASNPRLNGCCYHAGLRYRPSEKGIDVCGSAGPTVFVKHQIRPSKFTIIPWMAGKNYLQDDVVFDPVTGECYRALADNVDKPTGNIDTWVTEPFPEIFGEYVKAGAYADGLTETDQTDINRDPVHVSARLKLAGIAEAEAQEHLYREIDLLLRQGEKHYYTGRYYYVYPTFGYCTSPPWTGTYVTTLTDLCVGHAPEPGPTPIPVGGTIPNGVSAFETRIPVTQTSLDAPFVDMVSTGGRWWELESVEGVYELDALITEIKRIVSFGKKILFRVGGGGGGTQTFGGNLPDWVMDAIGADPGVWDNTLHKWTRYPGNFQNFPDGAVTLGSPNVNSYRAYFSTADLHGRIKGPGIPDSDGFGNSFIGSIPIPGGPGILGRVTLSSSAVANVPINATATGNGLDIVLLDRPKVAHDRHDMVWGRTYDYLFRGSQATLAVFWDPIYLAKKIRHINEVGHQLFFTNRLTAAEKAAIAVVPVSFCAANTEDWNMPTKNDDTGHGQTQWAQWANLIDVSNPALRGMGYTTQLLSEAFVKRANAAFTTGQTFSNKRLVCADANFTHADEKKVVTVIGSAITTEIKIVSWVSKNEVLVNQNLDITGTGIGFTIIARDTGIADVAAAAFPGAIISNAVGFTFKIDEPAALLAGDDDPDSYMARLVHGTLRTKYVLPSGLPRVIAQINQLSNQAPVPPGTGSHFELMDRLRTEGSDTAAQMLWHVFNDPQYRMNGGSAADPFTGEILTDRQIMERTVTKGKAYGFHFIEIYSRDIADTTTNPEALAALEFAHNLLTTT